MTEPATSALIIKTGWVLVHFAWQAAAVGLCHGLLIRRCRHASPLSRYKISLAALLLLLAMPVLTVTQLQSGTPVPAKSNAAAETTALALTVNPASAEQGHTNAPLEQRLLPWVVAVWLLGVLLYSIRFLLGYLGVRRIIRQADPEPIPSWLSDELETLRRILGISKRIRLAVSDLIDSPMVTGWLAPTILLPVCATTRLTPGQLRMALVHELAHVRRNDYLVNILQVIAETLFFFHPVVHQVSRSLRREREQCCDDMVTEYCGNRLAYARLLADLETLRHQPPEFALGIASAGTESELAGRVNRIVGMGEPASMKMRLDWAMLLPLVLAIALLAIRETLPEREAFKRQALQLPAAVETEIPAPIRAGEQENMPASEGSEESPQAVTDSVAMQPPAQAGAASANSTAIQENQAAGGKQEQAMSLNTASNQEPVTGGTQVTDEPLIEPVAPVSGNASETAITDEEPVMTGGKLVNVVQPDYPRYAFRHGVEGRVTVSFTVGADGRVRNASVIEATPSRVFNDAAIDAIRQWRFTPFLLDGEPVAQDLKQTLDFRIGGESVSEGVQRDCDAMTGTRICRSGYGNGSNVVTYRGSNSRTGR